MTEDNQHNAGEQQTPMQPQPLPGQVFVRPGIDDRPDYEKTLTEETKAALKRLAVQQNPRVPEASNERPEVQQTLINTEGGSPLTAFAHLDAAGRAKADCRDIALDRDDGAVGVALLHDEANQGSGG